MPHDVFICYRRSTGVNDARLLQQALAARGYEVFFDYDALRDGPFDERILETIGETPVFIVLLTEGSLDRCSEPGDWVRRELEHAFETGRHILPVAPSDQKWSFPDSLPPSLGWLPVIQVSTMYKTELFEASIDKIVEHRFPANVKQREFAQRIEMPPDQPANPIAWTGVAEPVSRKCSTEPVSAPPQTGGWDVFISHSSEDKEVVRRYAAALRDAGISYWLDSESIPRGASYPKEIMRGIEGSSLFLLLYSDNVAKKPEDVLNEIENAKKMRKEMISVRLDRTEYTAEFQYYLSRFQWIDAAERDESAVFGEMVQSIRSRLPKPESAPPSEQDAEAEIAASINALSQKHFDQRRFEEAAEEGKRAVALCRVLVERHPGFFREELRRALYNEGKAVLQLHRFNEAETLLKKALGIAESLAVDESSAHLSDLAETVNRLGTLHLLSGRKSLSFAKQEYEKALSIRRRLAALDQKYEPALAESLNNMGSVSYNMGRREEARQSWEESLAVYRRLSVRNPGCYDWDTARTLINLVGLSREDGKTDAMAQEADEAIRMLRPLAKSNQARFGILLASALYNRSFASTDRKQWSEAEQFLVEAFDLSLACVERNPEADERVFRDVWEMRLHVFEETENDSEAVQMMTRVISLYSRLDQSGVHNSEWKKYVAQNLRHLASLLLIHGRKDDARRELEEARRLDPGGL